MAQDKHVHSIIDHQVRDLNTLYGNMSDAHDKLLNMILDFQTDVEWHIQFMKQADVVEHMRDTDISVVEWEKLKDAVDLYANNVAEQDDVMTDMFHKFTSLNRARSSDG